MSAPAKLLLIFGIILTLLGSFLPWRREGDFVSYWTYGIRVYPTLKDNGGLLIVLLTLIMIILAFLRLTFVEKPLVWSILVSLVLVFDSAFHIGKLLIARTSAAGAIGAPTIQIGLVMVSIGSLLLLFSGGISFFKSS
jgi:hypothetical protein